MSHLYPTLHTPQSSPLCLNPYPLCCPHPLPSSQFLSTPKPTLAPTPPAALPHFLRALPPPCLTLPSSSRTRPPPRPIAMDLPDLMSALTPLRGVGPWSVHMLAMFHMGLPDVLPAGDLGVRRGLALLHGLQHLPEPEEAERLTEPWRPYRYGTGLGEVWAGGRKVYGRRGGRRGRIGGERACGLARMVWWR